MSCLCWLLVGLRRLGIRISELSKEQRTFLLCILELTWGLTFFHGAYKSILELSWGIIEANLGYVQQCGGRVEFILAASWGMFLLCGG